MPGFQIHIAIGKRYIDKHNEIQNVEEFLDGVIAPDFVEDKSKSHYTVKTPKENLKRYLASKVNLEAFLQENKVESDYEKGVFLHLLTDKLFFTEFLPDEYIKNVDYSTFCKDLYTSYDETNHYLEEKYNIQFNNTMQKKIQKNIQDSKRDKEMDEERGNNILPIGELDKFIEYVSNIDLCTYTKRDKKLIQ